MIDKIALINNKIAFLRYTVSWAEETFILDVDEKGKSKRAEDGSQIKLKKVTPRIVEVPNLDSSTVKMLIKRGVEYTAAPIIVPQELEKYEGMVWDGTRDEALKMINNTPEYELKVLEEWFREYDLQVAQYHRASRLGSEFDKNITELDALAEQKAARIKKLRLQLNIHQPSKLML